MNTPEELLQENLERLENGAPLETIIQELPEHEAELLKLSVMLREAAYPVHNQIVASTQRDRLLKTAAQKSNGRLSPQNALHVFFQQLTAWLQPAFSFSGAIAFLLILVVGLSIGGFLASRSAEEQPVEVAQTTATPTTQTEQIAATETAVSTPATSAPVLATPAPDNLAYLPVFNTPLVRDPHTATLSQVQGLVEVQNNDGTWTAVSQGDSLTIGQRIRTSKLSQATLAFYDGSQTTLQAQSELSLDELDARTDGPRTIVMTQWIGESDHNVAPAADENGRFLVNTPTGSGTAKGTIFHVIVTPNLLTFFNVTEGVVDVTSLNITIIVVAGQGTLIPPGQPPTPPYFRITGEGQVTEIGELWVIGGQSFATTENTIFVGLPEVGDWVFVEGHLLPDGTRIADRIILLTQPPDPSFTLTGVVENISDQLWVIAGQSIVVNDATIITGDIVVGDQVVVTGNIATGGTLIATHIEQVEPTDGLPFEFTGLVQTIDTETWLISGVTIFISETTEIEDGILLGDIVQVEGRILENGRWLADEINKIEDEDRRFEFTGIVETIDPWQVSGINFETRHWTDIDPGIQPGDLVQVEGRIQEDGTWVASEIHLLDNNDILITFIGIVSSIDPWIVDGILLSTDENTLIASGIEVGTLVRVRALLLSDGTWLALSIRPLIPIIGGCFDISGEIISINGNELQIGGWGDIIMDDDILIDGDLQPESIIIIHLCYQNGNIIIIHIIVIYTPIIIIVPPVPQPPPTNNDAVVICHKPGRNQQTMTVTQSALGGHLGHGDTMGPCAETGGPGGSDNGNGNGNKKDD